MSDYLAGAIGLNGSDLYQAPLELIQQCLAGKESAFVAVYNEYAHPIYRLCFSLLDQPQDAEEVLQDTFEYAFRKLDRYDARRSSFKTWLYQIAVSRCRNKRRRKLLPTSPLAHFRDTELPDLSTPTHDDVLVMGEKQRVVWEAIWQLSPKLRETAVLRYYEGLSYSEIAAILSVPTKTAESRMRLAHQKIKDFLLADCRWER